MTIIRIETDDVAADLLLFLTMVLIDSVCPFFDEILAEICIWINLLVRLTYQSNFGLQYALLNKKSDHLNQMYLILKSQVEYVILIPFFSTDQYHYTWLGVAIAAGLM